MNIAREDTIARQIALDHAMKYSYGRNYSLERIVETAEAFRKFLEGDTNDGQE